MKLQGFYAGCSRPFFCHAHSTSFFTQLLPSTIFGQRFYPRIILPHFCKCMIITLFSPINRMIVNGTENRDNNGLQPWFCSFISGCTLYWSCKLAHLCRGWPPLLLATPPRPLAPRQRPLAPHHHRPLTTAPAASRPPAVRQSSWGLSRGSTGAAPAALSSTR